VLFARMPTILIACALRQEATEHAMLHVKDGQVMVRNHLDAVAPDLPCQVANLLRVEVMRGVRRFTPSLK
jgi:hypothetical protein